VKLLCTVAVSAKNTLQRVTLWRVVGMDRVKNDAQNAKFLFCGMACGVLVVDAY